MSGNTLYAGGNFTTAGGVSANYVAKWDGSEWSALGGGMAGGNYPYVYALAVSETTLYAGGSFTDAGGVVANNIAKWNGSAWSALGEGVDSDVYALAVSGTTLYAGGWFTTAGGVSANYIAKWDGSVWSALASGMDNVVSALAVSGPILYAGGSFTTGVAAWNGWVWSGLGSGIGGAPNALLADGSGHLYVGGDFSMAGTNVSPYIAQANIDAGISGGRFSSLTYSPATGFGWTFSDGSVGQSYRIQTSTSLAADTWTDFIGFIYGGPVFVNSPAPGSEPRRFYRAVSP